MYPKSQIRVHIAAVMYPKRQVRVHVNFNVNL